MDEVILRAVEAAGIDTTLAAGTAQVRIVVDERHQVVPLRGKFDLVVGGQVVSLTSRPLSEAFRGNQEPPSFASGPTPEYAAFFALLERTVVEYCRVAGRAETDDELERLYRQVRRRPDGQDKNLLSSYIQAAAFVYASLVDTSRAEFEAVLNRLSRSASHFRTGPTTTSESSATPSRADAPLRSARKFGIRWHRSVRWSARRGTSGCR
jgi:hypothetical protein